MGTLDGGHILYSVFGKKASKIAPFIFVALILLGSAWQGWWLWAFMLYFLGRRHAEPLDQITELDPMRKKIALFMLIVFILVFIPVPLVVYG
jgi:membrane-associated protease RseP (regulator of RpoE activity)